MSKRDKIDEMVGEVLAPLLERDGGGIGVAAYEGAVLTLRLSGAIAGCPGTPYIKRHVIEPAIRRAAGPDVEIVYERMRP